MEKDAVHDKNRGASQHKNKHTVCMPGTLLRRGCADGFSIDHRHFAKGNKNKNETSPGGKKYDDIALLFVFSRLFFPQNVLTLFCVPLAKSCLHKILTAKQNTGDGGG